MSCRRCTRRSAILPRPSRKPRLQALYANSEIVPMNVLHRASRLAISPLPTPTAWYAIPLRLIIGFGFMQHGYAKLARGLTDDFINLLRHGHSLRLPAWVGDHDRRDRRRAAHPPWRACSAGDDTNGHRPARRHLHGSSSERLQFYQASIIRRCGRPFRPTRVRNRPPLSCRTYRTMFGGSWTVFS